MPCFRSSFRYRWAHIITQRRPVSIVRPNVNYAM